MNRKNAFRAALVGALLGSLLINTALPASAGTVIRTFSSGSIAAPIPDETDNNDGILLKSIRVDNERRIKDLNVKLRLNHTWDGQLAIYLITPQGRVVQLSVFNGADGDNYGSGSASCSGTPTVFNDEAQPSITEGTAPFTGGYRPETPLSVVDGKRATGKWQLLILDDQDGEVGTLYCWQLRMVLET